MPTRTLFSKPRFLWWAIVVSLVFIAIGVWMIREGQWLGWPEVILWSFGLAVLIAMGFRDRHWLRLEADGFCVGVGKHSWKHAWADIDAFWADENGVAYQLKPEREPRDPDEDPDDQVAFAYFPDLYGLTANALLEVLLEYKR